jgi:hypothetical protein
VGAELRREGDVEQARGRGEQVALPDDRDLGAERCCLARDVAHAQVERHLIGDAALDVDDDAVVANRVFVRERFVGAGMRRCCRAGHAAAEALAEVPTGGLKDLCWLLGLVAHRELGAPDGAEGAGPAAIDEDWHEDLLVPFRRVCFDR